MSMLFCLYFTPVKYSLQISFSLIKDLKTKAFADWLILQMVRSYRIDVCAVPSLGEQDADMNDFSYELNQKICYSSLL